MVRKCHTFIHMSPLARNHGPPGICVCVCARGLEGGGGAFIWFTGQIFALLDSVVVQTHC